MSSIVKSEDVKSLLKIIDQILSAYANGKVVDDTIYPDGTKLTQGLNHDQVIELYELKDLLTYYL